MWDHLVVKLFTIWNHMLCLYYISLQTSVGSYVWTFLIWKIFNLTSRVWLFVDINTRVLVLKDVDFVFIDKSLVFHIRVIFFHRHTWNNKYLFNRCHWLQSIKELRHSHIKNSYLQITFKNCSIPKVILIIFN